LPWNIIRRIDCGTVVKSKPRILQSIYIFSYKINVSNVLNYYFLNIDFVGKEPLFPKCVLKKFKNLLIIWYQKSVSIFVLKRGHNLYKFGLEFYPLFYSKVVG